LKVRNTFFQFKQFRIDQANAAMKVTTEGATLGAVVHDSQPLRVLDIGTGTGLIALMLAQRFSESLIDAIEINESAAKEALHNFHQSPWKNRLQLIKADIRDWNVDYTYDLIISNPPFFKDSLKSKNREKNTAIHDDYLSAIDLVQAGVKYLKLNGQMTVMYPEFESEKFKKIATAEGLNCTHQVDLYDNPDASMLRRITTFQKTRQSLKTGKLIIKSEKGGSYTSEFIQLLKPFYLYL
jgi:tRNA1Val (adenine37-N6)-methyltransferase